MEAEKLVLQIKKHTRYAHLAQILKICRQSKTKMEIYQQVVKMITYPMLTRLLEIATQHKLVRKQGGLYQTTRKGEKYIKTFNEILRLLS